MWPPTGWERLLASPSDFESAITAYRCELAMAASRSLKAKRRPTTRNTFRFALKMPKVTASERGKTAPLSLVNLKIILTASDNTTSRIFTVIAGTSLKPSPTSLPRSGVVENFILSEADVLRQRSGIVRGLPASRELAIIRLSHVQRPTPKFAVTSMDAPR